LCINDAQDIETSGGDAAEEWLSLVNWEEDLAVKDRRKCAFTLA